MRYADGPTTGGEVRIDASPSTVWALVSDIATPARFSPELRRVEWLDGAQGPTPGAVFAGYNENERMGAWRTTSRVGEVAEERAFSWDVVDLAGTFGPPKTAETAVPLATWRFDLTAAEGGGTVLGHSVRIGPAPSRMTSYIEEMPDREEEIIAHRLKGLRQGIEATLEGIRKLAETDGARPSADA
ncbi:MULTISPECIES: SRPBCC family protein [unclassified Streptomyces]|uniref:SRPBCC family protein n=1 Tax=unclassified Streptomyces TaxID=2593676 RepID=UPI0022B5F1AF|nr:MULTISPECIES: SRPBCC family protein [unclassified Streptomyces]MCZ7417454.1 SRPBCC family protein [Streptomyces sp. WMMC897]MCZ7432718.1 SRPBCC family protein [Streptomyces sp. WMMC1477]